MVNRDYSSEIQKLAHLLRAAFDSAVSDGQPKYSIPLQQLTNICFFSRYLVERDEIGRAPRGIRILYGKLSDCVWGVRSLLYDGFPGPAAMVLRSLFETSVNLQVILKQDTTERCKLFEDYLHIERGKISLGSDVEQQIVKDNLAKVRSNYHPKKPLVWCWKIVPSNNMRKGVPDNPTIRDLCNHIERPEYYDLVYGRLSAAIHCVPSYEIWMRRADGQMELGPKFFDHTQHIAILASRLVVDALARTVRFLEPDDQNELIGYILGLGTNPQNQQPS